MKKLAIILTLIGTLAFGSFIAFADGPGPKRIAIAVTQGVYDSKREEIRNAVGDMWFNGTNSLTEAQKDWADSGWLDLRLISDTNKIVKVYWVSQGQIKNNVDAATIAKWKAWLDNNPGADAIITYGKLEDVKQHWALTNINEEAEL